MQQAIRSFLEAKQSQSLSPRTMESYRHVLADLVRECPALPATAEEIRRAMNKAHTIWVRDAYWRIWGIFFRWAGKEYSMPNAMERVEKPKLPEVELRALEPRELALTVSAARNDRERAIVALALDSGVRASEFGPLHEVDVASDTIRVLGKGNRQLRVPISPETHRLLEVLAENNGRSPLLFPEKSGKGISRHTVYRIVRGCMTRAGIPGPKLGPHCLRHSLGTNYIANGGDAFTLQRIMRHRHLNTTQRYVHCDMHRVVEAHEKYSPYRAALKGAQGVFWERQVEEAVAAGEKGIA